MKPQLKKDKETIRRMRPKKGFSKFLKGKVRTFHAHVNEFEDDTASSTVVRWLVVVLLLHLVFIGGASLHGFLVKNRNAAAVDVPVAQAVAVQPVVQQPAVQAVPAVPAPSITETGSIVETGTAPAVEPAVPVVSPTPEAPAQPGPVRHMVATGDSWDSIARDNGCTVLALQTVNPGARLTSGTTLVIPLKPGEENIPVAEEVTGEEVSGEIYVIKKGDTLSKVARKYKVSVAAIQKHNGITDPGKLKIGQEIKIPGK